MQTLPVLRQHLVEDTDFPTWICYRRVHLNEAKASLVLAALDGAEQRCTRPSARRHVSRDTSRCRLVSDECAKVIAHEPQPRVVFHTFLFFPSLSVLSLQRSSGCVGSSSAPYVAEGSAARNESFMDWEDGQDSTGDVLPSAERTHPSVRRTVSVIIRANGRTLI